MPFSMLFVMDAASSRAVSRFPATIASVSRWMLRITRTPKPKTRMATINAITLS
jgi:hypothetical protein